MIDKVRLPSTVAEQLDEVRCGGACNMLDRPCVQAVAADLGAAALARGALDRVARHGERT